MARLYADEQYPLPIVEFLRTLGHDVLTVQEAGKANQQISDMDVLTFATSDERAVITENRKDFFSVAPHTARSCWNYRMYIRP
jgi:predicted nuclease of predicted toxin-antitoxin system